MPSFVPLVIALAASLACQDPPAKRQEPHGPPFTKVEVEVLERCFGMATESQAIECLDALSKPWWKEHQLFAVVNFTWPHTPYAIVARTKTGEVLSLSELSDGLGDTVLTNFNRVARAEARVIAEKDVRTYVGFVFRCWVGWFRPVRFIARSQDAQRILAGDDPPWHAFGGFDPSTLELEETKTGWRCVAHYVDSKRLLRVQIDVARKDGTVKLSWRPVAVDRDFWKEPR
ncbi:MAG: hypothetical protein H6834_12435 [Planctomycetes bacterium]|nr:hypothetical protein [Planctomycetota bacterium]